VNPRLLALVLSCLLVLTGLLAVLAARVDGPSAAHDAAPAPPPRAEAEVLAVLREWDDRRSRAWAAGDPADLRALYAPGSRSGRHDSALLAAYADRGLRVAGLHVQVLALEVRERSPGELTFAVTDRTVGGVAVGVGTRLPLPADRPSTWLVSMVRVAGEWRVAEVQASPAASTAATSGWRKR
jgi:hypothetical protein